MPSILKRLYIQYFPLVLATPYKIRWVVQDRLFFIVRYGTHLCQSDATSPVMLVTAQQGSSVIFSSEAFWWLFRDCTVSNETGLNLKKLEETFFFFNLIARFGRKCAATYFYTSSFLTIDWMSFSLDRVISVIATLELVCWQKTTSVFTKDDGWCLSNKNIKFNIC